MRSSLRRFGAFAGTAVLAVLCAGSAAAATGPESPAPPGTGEARPAGCLTYDGSETSVSIAPMPITGPVMTKQGDSVDYFDTINDTSGALVGSAVGLTTVVRVVPGNGHLIGSYHEVVELPDGTFRDEGTIDRTAMLGGAWVSFPVTGLTGRFAGMHGVRSWQVTDIPTRTVHIWMRLCH